MPDQPRLRIAQLANFVGPVSGGMKVAINALGQGYVAAGHERILVIPGKRDHTEETENGIVVEVRAPRISADYRMIAAPWRALDVLDRFKPTSIEVSDKWTLSPAARWAARRGIGSALFSHERLDDMLALWLKRQFGVESVVSALNRRLSTSFDAVVVTSNYAAEEFRDTGADLHHVPLGVDLDTFRLDAGAPPSFDEGHRIELCYVGRMSHEKSPDLALATALELHRRGHPVHLTMYGVGPDLEKLKKQAGDGPVTFAGFVKGREQVAAKFAASHLSLSVCPAETFGLAVLEALACGTPVVTSNRGGACELIDASCGASATPDAASLADACETVIARLSPDLRLAARARAEQFSWHHSVERMLDLHHQLAQTSGPARSARVAGGKDQ